MTTLKFQVVPFKNDLDQTIEPGERVVVITSGYNKSLRIKEATYLGNIPGAAYYDGGVVVVYDDGRHSKLPLRRVYRLDTLLTEFSYL